MSVDNNAAERKKRTGGVTGRGFKKGQSGNPGGRPKSVKDVKEAAREHTMLAIERLVHWAKSDEPKASVAASNALLDRAWGKAPMKFEDEDGNNGLTVIIKNGDKC
ncbi:DUF5681 domain-containing protein [Acetobacter senegalensis]|uniref:DUF5681 domain-containing protein n=1 Tax=Acetobacter senegalensis TaxID=446692 RepID=UPI00264E867E|nr:DUF5681 domain-containing protein [Acetobacter senegalensis]MDN7356337.1 DUF5681 domain-containing protein [Acetobacter senegalensis]